jgi:pimeloyl-ACP methyl ester carboxylesterase
MTTTDPYDAAQHRYLEAERCDARSRTIEVELADARGSRTIRTHVLERGEGPPLVLLHGGGGLAAGWAPLLARLSGHRLIAPDRPGCGASDGFDYRGVDLQAHAVRWLEQVLDGCGVESAVFVANSMGARWATWLALEHPHRVRGIAALGMPAFLLETSAPVPMRLLGRAGIGPLMMALERPSTAQARRLWGRMGHDPTAMSEALVELTVALQQRREYSLAWRTLLGRCLSLGGAQPGMSIDAEQLARLSMPIVFAIGANDPFGGRDVAERAASHAPDATVEALGVGHLPWLDEPDAAAALVQRFVERVSTAVRGRELRA